MVKTLLADFFPISLQIFSTAANITSRYMSPPSPPPELIPDGDEAGSGVEGAGGTDSVIVN